MLMHALPDNEGALAIGEGGGGGGPFPPSFDIC